MYTHSTPLPLSLSLSLSRLASQFDTNKIMHRYTHTHTHMHTRTHVYSKTHTQWKRQKSIFCCCFTHTHILSLRRTHTHGRTNKCTHTPATHTSEQRQSSHLLWQFSRLFGKRALSELGYFSGERSSKGAYHVDNQYSPHHTLSKCTLAHVGWLRLVGSLRLLVSFAEYSLFHRVLLQKRPIILRSLLIVATTYNITTHAKMRVEI